MCFCVKNTSMRSSNFNEVEKASGNKAANFLKKELRNSIKSSFNKKSGVMQKTTVRAVLKRGSLDRLTIVSPRYSYMLQFGSDKTASVPRHVRASYKVSSFSRKQKGKTQQVKTFRRSSSFVRDHQKSSKLKAYSHITKALVNSNPAFEELATDLAENRIISIVSHLGNFQ